MVLAASGCAHLTPLPIDERAIATDVARRFALVFPEAASSGHGVGLMRPRFGIPAFLDGAGAFSITVLERGAPARIAAALVQGELSASEAERCLAAATATEDCVPLSLEEQPPESVDPTCTLRRFRAHTVGSTALRRYDLVIKGDDSPLERARASVFLFAPAAPDAPLSAIHLSDLHVGRDGEGEREAARLARVVREVNALRPDVVIVTGDMAEQGHTAALEEAAAAALQHLLAPVLVVIGNHDYGRFAHIVTPEQPGRGYYNFARAFHAYRFYRTTIGRWDFIAFDSGPSVLSAAVRTRGISMQTLDQIADALGLAGRAGQDVLLFSHASTRTAISSDPDRQGKRGLGSMLLGAGALEQLMTDASQRGMQAMYLSGHTHWSDLFVGARDGVGFSRVPYARLTCPASLDAPLLLVNAPSATRISFPTLEHGQHFGYVWLELARRRSVVRFHLFDAAGTPRPCPP